MLKEESVKRAELPMKEKMIDTCIALFGRKGFRETSIKDIVEANGMTKGTFYYYFKSKEDVLVYIHDTFISGLLHKQRKIMQTENYSYKEKLYAVVEMMILNIAEGVDSAMVFFREMRHLSEAKTKEILPKRDQFQKNIQEIIEGGISKGEFRSDLRADMLSYAILGIANWSYFWYEPGGEVKEQELTNIYMNIILQGIEEGKK
ncbi:TetR family transcriptional regulator [Halobacillus andaensis]|uniref:TetR family transcriptional regulator n=1 Tax=Halobacillus andaensis TaxID=1176239 RepID=A0A917B669_HALAA|nr:TetR/AcrR family transcriptional regulator [Halobacillus andaensis]MBP2005916.1 AcrR family transcriptional regulator [Halobacillus andaensis]GGF25068.1 TetR family transcriptional regulator [Halobacillus andaensis]